MLVRGTQCLPLAKPTIESGMACFELCALPMTRSSTALVQAFALINKWAPDAVRSLRIIEESLRSKAEVSRTFSATELAAMIKQARSVVSFQIQVSRATDKTLTAEIVRLG